MLCVQSSIQSFARVSKALPNTDKQQKKRKVAFEEPIRESTVADTKRRRLQHQTPPETPTKSCKRAFADLTLCTPTAPPKSIKRKRADDKKANVPLSPPPSRSPSSDPSHELNSNATPPELFDMIQLNSAFLSALSLHCAHNGSVTTIDIRNLTPSITKMWGMRKVVLDDVRLCIGVLQNTSSPRRNAASDRFHIKNYGNGRICLEMSQVKRRAGKVIGQPFNETLLKKLFEQRIESSWEDFAAGGGDNASWDSFMTRLPLAEVRLSSSFGAAHPLVAKGQQRLEEVLGSREVSTASKANERKKRKTTETEPLKDITNRAPSTSPAKIRQSTQIKAGQENATSDFSAITANIKGLSLFDRIREKELLQASLPAAPTKAQLDRQAALQRSSELLGILDMLATSKGSGMRASFPFPALVRSVQSSVRSPMGKDEIERCIQILEKEIAPGHVSMAKFGSIVGVVVNRMSKPSDDLVKARLMDAGVV